MPDNVVGISLFSGCGGLDLGASYAGVSIAVSIDFDKDCVKTLRVNKEFKDTHIIFEDVRKVSTETLKNILNGYKYSKKIVFGGPPCQPFSKAGYWIGNQERKKDKDPRNMVEEFLRIISELRPDGFLFENVESLAHPTNKHVLFSIVEEVEAMGYHYKIVKANALDYGVPQKRKRIFVIGSRVPFKTQSPKVTHCPPEMANFFGLKPYESVGKFIGKFDKPEFFEPEEIAVSGTYGDALLEVPRGKNYLALTAGRGHPDPKFVAGKRFWSFLLKLHPELPSWTIPAQPGPWVGPFHWTSRRLRVPEIASIQTFPETYVFVGSRRSIQRQIGNAVPPLLGKTMVEFLLENL